jgi:hypothetical protein
MDPIAKEYIEFYGFHGEKEGGWVLCGDNGRFTNHSENPSIRAKDLIYTYATRDINIGDEITEDYYYFDKSAANKLGKNNN